MSVSERVLSRGRIAVYRHPALVRLTHWINAVCLLVLLMSGLQILNAHPALYWGESSAFDRALVAYGSGETAAFPHWITLPGWQDLGAGRRWHFFFAWVFAGNGLLYLGYLIFSGRLQRMLLPSSAQLLGISASVLDHLRLRFPRGEAALEYNVLQKLTYLFVLFGLVPLMVLTGITMSPAMDALLPFLTELFGGRQSARTIHFFTAFALVLFFIVHIAAVIAAGAVTEMRSMVTGWFVFMREDGNRER